MRRAWLWAAGGLMLAAALVGEAAGPDTQAGAVTGGVVPARCTPPPAGDSAISLVSGGLRRTARVHVPPGLGAASRPALVLVLHFGGGTGAQMEALTRFSAQADRSRFVAVYPDAVRRLWTTGTRPGPDDVVFLRSLLDALAGRVCQDPRRVYATGASNGGTMADVLACRLPDRIAAIAQVSSVGVATAGCGAAPVSVLQIHGTADPLQPYAGKPANSPGTVARLLAAWYRHDGCRGTPARSPIAGGLELRWRPCRQGAALEHVRLIGFGHGWPGAASPPIGGVPSRFPATRSIWTFFAAHPRPAG